MVKLAEARGAVMLHENEKGIYGDNASRCRDLMEQFYGRHFQAVFDFANFVEVGQETLEAYELLKPYLAYIHIKDVSKALGKVVPAGKGDGKVREILSDLIGSGWRGFLSLEPHLVDFSGLKALEQNAAARNAAMDGKTAWKTALDALREILRTIPGAEGGLGMNKRKSAIVGCGGIAQVHAKALRDGDYAELAACADIRPERAETMAQQYGGRAYSSLEEMLDGEAIDVLHICTPHSLHTPMAKEAVRQGIQVFTEKPLSFPGSSGRSFLRWGGESQSGNLFPEQI